ncbi:hypothetical protein [Spirosoma sp.]|uniref:hypothetical protein n=1 Tax=Spirosoma sp. TaxID=1899569 RepID=UPI00260842B3|nr:hypothetical protein [Spirosoma sp.]MCX6216407.1 hypothetical protein [Spirosoma sp.]
MRNVYVNWIKNGSPAFARLILCLCLLSSLNSTACTIDSLKILDPKPIRLTANGARQVLKDKASLIMLQGVVASQDTLLSQLQKAVSSQQKTVKTLNESRQAVIDSARQLQTNLDKKSRKLRAARLENWLVRGAAALYLALKLI